ncbi:MAG: GNAT family N-acetyltransferase [Nitrospirota bacterium]|nr:GNAT family N-acetyltransferase [Nitrospirota bacterium]MDH5768271.1 GNAT family N-acetyltransferase [Nitrospirota bacterium]
MSEKKLTIRLYKPGDEQGIINLFKEIFKREMTLEEWQWKYTGRGNKKVYSSVTVNENNQIVAHYGGIPHRMMYQGREVYGLAIGDVMVQPHYREFKLFRELAALVPDEAAIDGFILGYGFPQERLLRLSEKLGLYEKIEDVFEANKEVQFHKNMNRLLYKFFPMTYDDKRIDILWESVKKDFGLSVVRDREYLKWRYEKHPLFSYELWGLRKRWGRRLQGLAVLRKEEDKMLIIDFVVSDNLFSILFQKIENYAFSLGKKNLSLWHPEYLTDKLTELGFSINKTVTCIPRTTHEKGLKKEDLKGKFFYTMGDTDFL